MLTRRDVLRFAAVSAALPAWAFGSKEFWEAKPASEWSADEIDRMLTKSPWAKDASVMSNGGGFGNGGGSGRSRSGGGIGFPGGGGGISMDDKLVTFSTKLGRMDIKAKFTTKEMLYQGKLAV